MWRSEFSTSEPGPPWSTAQQQIKDSPSEWRWNVLAHASTPLPTRLSLNTVAAVLMKLPDKASVIYLLCLQQLTELCLRPQWQSPGRWFHPPLVTVWSLPRHRFSLVRVKVFSAEAKALHVRVCGRSVSFPMNFLNIFHSTEAVIIMIQWKVSSCSKMLVRGELLCLLLPFSPCVFSKSVPQVQQPLGTLLWRTWALGTWEESVWSERTAVSSGTALFPGFIHWPKGKHSPLSLSTLKFSLSFSDKTKKAFDAE